MVLYLILVNSIRQMATKIRKVIHILQDFFTKLELSFCPDCFKLVIIDRSFFSYLCLVYVLLKAFIICCRWYCHLHIKTWSVDSLTFWFWSKYVQGWIICGTSSFMMSITVTMKMVNKVGVITHPGFTPDQTRNGSHWSLFVSYGAYVIMK